MKSTKTKKKKNKDKRQKTKKRDKKEDQLKLGGKPKCPPAIFKKTKGRIRKKERERKKNRMREGKKHTWLRRHLCTTIAAARACVRRRTRAQNIPYDILHAKQQHIIDEKKKQI